MRSFEAYVERHAEAAKAALSDSLREIGEQLVDEAVSHGSYSDITGNLRSSIYYVVSDAGNIIYEGGADKIFDGDRGQARGKSVAHNLASRYNGLVLIMVAGMEYAAIVETHKNVLSSAQLLSEKLLGEVIKDLDLK